MNQLSANSSASCMSKRRRNEKGQCAMARELTVRIAGEAGQGIQSAGEALCRAVRHAGLHLFAHKDYMSRIRGGDNYFQVRIAEQPVQCPREQCDIIIALNPNSASAHAASVGEDGMLIADASEGSIEAGGTRLVDFPLRKTAESVTGSTRAANSIAAGVICRVSGVPEGSLEHGLRAVFAGRNEELVDKNLRAARTAYKMASSCPSPGISLEKSDAGSRLLIDGNQALALGAIRAGCTFYSAYPMTPSTSIMNTMAHFAQRYGLVVEQAEDEIAAINMVLGAWFAGARAMTASSGAGIALMSEGISLAGMTETPVVVVDAQRPAPATGFPTRTEQADLNMAIHSGHGEFVRAVYAPGCIEQAFALAVKAFNMADKYQMPAIILTDQFLADSIRDTAVPDVDAVQVERHVIDKEPSGDIKDYKRYTITESGISPRAVPSWIHDAIYADSDEHTEEGHITEDAAVRTQMVGKRLTTKLIGLSGEIEEPEAYNLDGADLVLVGFGSTRGVMREACDRVLDASVGSVHLSQVWPFPSTALYEMLEHAPKIMTVENNATGQLEDLITWKTRLYVAGAIRKFDGRPFTVDELMRRIREKV
ncbi:MAG: 2-oxoacid:acceptor oxidoreductase subunit alpha [Chitinivibrionales bacterium]|nr:2-oxoacid:acceptor oxidoreductase subunit alpha [Chitinivibrionales bacterium]MBD3397446.1 2-oxoacid:acceptor oxidoreductase subunit alpha [Chitinivibrionales bacterium]